MTRRALVVVSGVVAVMLLALPASAQTAGDVSPICAGRTGVITVTAGMRILPAALEVELTVDNRGTAVVRFEPSKALLRTGEGAIPSWTADQTKRAHRDYSTYALAGLLIGPLGLLVTGASQWNFTRYVDSRAFHPVDVAGGDAVRGSLFFPLPAKMGTRAVLELTGLGDVSGEPRVVRMYCALPRESSDAPVADGFVPLTVSLSARGGQGPAEVLVGAVELTANYTAIEMTVVNASETEAEIFGAMVNASVTDAAGTVYQGQLMRSEFTNLVLPKKNASARLVFAPLPRQVPSATLMVPGIRYGLETVDVKVELRF